MLQHATAEVGVIDRSTHDRGTVRSVLLVPYIKARSSIVGDRRARGQL
jgi:hypothetical protein